MTVQDLIDELQKFDPAADVSCTWEGTFNSIQVYQHADGVVLIDGDGGDYRVRFQELVCVVCGKPASVDYWENKPVCWGHSDTFRLPCTMCDELADIVQGGKPLCWNHALQTIVED